MKKTYRKKKSTRRKRYSRRYVKKYYKGGDPNSIPIFFIRKDDNRNKKCYLVYVGVVKEGEEFKYHRQSNIGDRYIKYNIYGINPNQANPERTSIITYDYEKRRWKGEVFDKNLLPMVFYMEPDGNYMMPVKDSDSTKVEITEEWRRQMRAKRPPPYKRVDYNPRSTSASPVTGSSPAEILLKKLEDYTSLEDNPPNIEFKCNVEVLKKWMFGNTYELKRYLTDENSIEATNIDVTVDKVESIDIYVTKVDRKSLILFSKIIETKPAYKMHCLFSGFVEGKKFNDKYYCVFDGEKFLSYCMEYTKQKINTIGNTYPEPRDYHSDKYLGPFPCPTNIQFP